MKLRNLGVLGAASLLAVTAAVPAFAQDKTLTIGVDLPLSGGEVVNGQPTLNGVQLAVDLANAAGGIGGYTLKVDAKDDAVNGKHDPGQGTQNVNAFVADETVIGMVGPFNSNVARAQIPVTNDAGLAQCSPSNTGTDLTQAGSEAYRSADAAKSAVRNYFRTATPDNIQGLGLAEYAYNELGARNAYVMDDAEAFGIGVADSFSANFIKLGGAIAKRDGNSWDNNKSFATALTAVQGLTPAIDMVFFGGTQVTGGGQMRKDMGAAGMLALPFVGPDGTTDLTPGGKDGAFITLAGLENSGNVFGSVAGVHDLPVPGTFVADYTAAFGNPPGAYSALAYSCAQIILQSLDAAIKAGAADPAALREGTRAAVFAGNPFDTLLGTLTVDPNGDSGTWLSFWKTDQAAEGGKGGWVFVKQQNFAPAAPAASGSPAGSTAP